MVLSWFSSRVNPIAVDIGTDTIKLLQVEPGKDGQNRLVAATCEVIPDEVRAKPVERDNFCGEAIRKMVNDGFRGRQVVTCLPSNQMAVQHLRMGKMNAEELVKALPFEAAGKLPFDAGRAVLRHTIAGEVYQNQEAKQEVIVMAAPRDVVDRHLNVLSKAKLEVVGIHVEPTALIECFGHLFKRKGDENISTLFIDMGAGSTHVVIAHGKSMVFAKHIHIGGDLFNRRVAETTGRDMAKARELRIQVTHRLVQAPRLPAGVVAIGGDSQTHPLGKQNGTVYPQGASEEQMNDVKAALAEPLAQLVTDLQMCLRYYESIFPGRSVDRAIFIGGESRHVANCQAIAQRLGVPATLGDPLARLVKDEVAKTTVDLRQPQPGWAIAAGLGIGLVPQSNEKSE
ncbi:MAG TPA: pilus assembly protein PilM [Phycisphaerae bacterium]|nr:pilus assembly protein PilM [Phycisphaerae bacterium]